MDKAKEIQDNCHAVVSEIMKKSKSDITYQDATNVFLFQKLAELELRIDNLWKELNILK